jgi:hypothetical protein
MRNQLFLRKASVFKIYNPLPGLSNFYIDYEESDDPHAWRNKMKKVQIHSDPPGKGAWYSAEDTVNAAKPGIHPVYFPLDINNKPITTNNVLAAAPCPPFCDDENP